MPERIETLFPSKNEIGARAQRRPFEYMFVKYEDKSNKPFDCYSSRVEVGSMLNAYL